MTDGYLHPDFADVARVLRRQLKGAAGGAAVCIYHRGKLVADFWGGYRNDSKELWLPDTMSVSFSTSKGVASTAIHILADRGLIDYDERVAHYWPEFAQNGKSEILVRHVLCHEAGLYGLRSCIDHADRMLDWEHMVERLAQAKPAHEPGAMNSYHGISYGWLVGELIRRITGKTISQFIQEEIAAPLELDGLYIGAPPEVHDRVAQLIRPARELKSPEALRPAAKRLQKVFDLVRLPVSLPRMADALLPTGIAELDWSSPEVISAAIPGANGVFTARSLAKMYATLAAGGTLDGVTLVSPRTLDQATEIQNRRIDGTVPFPMRWRLGYHRVTTTRGTLKHGFGHFGFGGSGAWADRERNLAVAMVLNSGVGTPFGDLRIVQLSGAALRCAERR